MDTLCYIEECGHLIDLINDVKLKGRCEKRQGELQSLLVGYKLSFKVITFWERSASLSSEASLELLLFLPSDDDACSILRLYASLIIRTWQSSDVIGYHDCRQVDVGICNKNSL